MSGFYTGLAATANSLLDELGFDVVLQEFTEASNQFDLTDGSWSNVATIKMAWQTRAASQGIKFEAPDSKARYVAYVKYRDDFSSTQKGSKLAILYNGNRYSIASAQIEGDKVLSVLLLEDGVPA